ncbi:MAG: family 1 glycosylhydrolase [Rhodothermales bacterium]|nr:family 1 glycosylhydrolase [Rhodothermales bacterium]MBO6778143.1 family 1 glycosylhydrolase [Rhodothermales bacterium]
MRALLPLLTALLVLLSGCRRPVGQAEPFPEDFVWGAGNAAFQEVTLTEAHVQALRAVGLTHYRLSLDWAALLPDGENLNTNEADRVAAELALLNDAGVEPLVVLYQGDMPARFLDEGGWASAESPVWFEHYARQAFDAFGDAVSMWVTMADPFRDRLNAHRLPVEPDTTLRPVSAAAPPFVQARRAARAQNPEQSTRALLATRLTEMHHMLQAHARAKAAGAQAPIGLIVGAAPVHPADPENDGPAADLEDQYRNGFLLGGLYEGAYPSDLLEALALDLDAPETEADFLGIDYFAPVRVEADSLSEHMGVRLIPNLDGDKSAFGEADARSLHAILTQVADRYDNPPVYVTGNGAAYGPIDELNAAGRIRDELRVRFLRRHLVRAQLAAADGVDLRGFFVWSAFDAAGPPVSGIIAIDSVSGQPVFKDSARYLRSIAAANAVSRMPF